MLCQADCCTTFNDAKRDNNIVQAIPGYILRMVFGRPYFADGVWEAIFYGWCLGGHILRMVFGRPHFTDGVWEANRRLNARPFIIRL